MDDNFEIPVDVESLPENLDDTQEALIVQGAIDAVDGNESYAARYLAGCMIGAGLMPSTVHGQEGVIDSIKSGMGKTVTYIKNFFMGIWNYFFGKSEEKDEEVIEKSEATLKTELKELSAGAKLKDEAKAAIKNAGSKIITTANSLKEKAKSLNDEYELANKLKSVLTSIADTAEKAGNKAKEVGVMAVADTIAFASQMRNTWVNEVKPKLRGELKAAAEKTKELIKTLEFQAKLSTGDAKDALTKKLNELKEAMKVYASIKQLKSSFVNFCKGVLEKLKPSFFTKKEA